MKYQLNVYWKDGSASGRVIDVRWKFPRALTYMKRVSLVPFNPVIRVALAVRHHAWCDCECAVETSND